MFTITANLKYVMFLQCWRNLWWGTLGGSEHRNTTKKFYKYRNLAKKSLLVIYRTKALRRYVVLIYIISFSLVLCLYNHALHGSQLSVVGASVFL